MKTAGIDNDITITDDIRFILKTTDSEGCLSTPYKVNRVTIYFIAREFTNQNVSEYVSEVVDPKLQKQYEEAKQLACSSPTEENLNNLNNIKLKINNSKFTSSYYFKEAIPIKIFGGYVDEVIGVTDVNNDPHQHNHVTYTSSYSPAWLNPDLVPIETKSQVEQDNILVLESEGQFHLDWSALGTREGDYFICWNWTPNIAGSNLSAHQMFNIGSNTKMTASIPTHYTKADKYEILMDRYLPSMFKTFISDNDLSPYVLSELNKSVAKGFTFIEDFVNQIIDLLDANSIHEQLIPLLSNLFNLNLKSNDPTLWRKQTKKAIANFKRKGTLGGLKSALSDAGMSLLKLTKLWQVSSKYTYQEHFVNVDNSKKFTLSKSVILPIIEDNFELWHRGANSNTWIKLDSSYIDIQYEDKFILNWLGDLDVGDSIRVLYQFSEIPSEEQSLDLYIRSLDLMDKRDEREQDYPVKNWNIRVLEEDDPLFDLIVNSRHPIVDPIVWGKIRTEFPYSENVYNMEEYNGSARDSFNSCDISKDFIDSCKNCQASVLSIDVEVEDLSNARISECRQAIEEFVPFHSTIHSLNFIGSNNEFVKSPIEEIQSIIKFTYEDVMIAGEAQQIFTRALSNSNRDLVKRNMLANMSDVSGSINGTAYNKKIMLYAPGTSTESDLYNPAFSNKSRRFDKLNVNITNISGDPLDNSNLLEVLAPSTNSGIYSVSSVSQGSFEVISRNLYAVIEPIDKSQFEFRISNKIYDQSLANIFQKDMFAFTSSFDFYNKKIITQKDIDDNVEAGPVYKLKIIDGIDIFEYDILQVLPNNKLIIKGPDNSDEFYIGKTNMNWQILGNGTVIGSGSDGTFAISRRGLVDLGSPPIDDIRDLVRIGDYVLYDEKQYKIKSFVNNENYKFYIEDYVAGDVGGVDVTIYRRIIENCVGQFDYSGMLLETLSNYESLLGIENGANSGGLLTKSNKLKENYLILIGTQYYSILDIDGINITLDGPINDWTTLGTSVNFTIYRFESQSLYIPESVEPPIPEYTFSQIMRSENEVITNAIELNFISNKILNAANSHGTGNELSEVAAQQESIQCIIEYKDGTKEEKEI
jgi:hypothetical protein